MDMMFAGRRQWKIMCCKTGRGACSACARRGVLAFVTSFSRGGSDIKYSHTSIRICDRSFQQKYPETELGLTMFHELMHMANGVGDKGYTKLECFNLAKNDPETARRNAAAYTFFAMESVMSKADYEKYSRGQSIMNEGCMDKASNCFALAKNGCAGRRVGSGGSL